MEFIAFRARVTVYCFSVVYFMLICGFSLVDMNQDPELELELEDAVGFSVGITRSLVQGQR